MKKLFLLAMVILTSIHILGLVVEKRQETRILSGDLVITRPTKGEFAGHEVWVDKPKRVITAIQRSGIGQHKVLWENPTGQVMYQISIWAPHRAPVMIDVVVTNLDTIAFYRDHLPQR